MYSGKYKLVGLLASWIGLAIQIHLLKINTIELVSKIKYIPYIKVYKYIPKTLSKIYVHHILT